MKIPRISQAVFAFLGIMLPIGAHLADYGPTHIFNPNWPPHAKFHGGQTLSFSIVLGFLTLLFAFKSSRDKNNAVVMTAIFASMYWVTQATAILYPGTYFWDSPEAAAYVAGLPVQLFIDVVALALTGVATWLGLKRPAR